MGPPVSMRRTTLFAAVWRDTRGSCVRRTSMNVILRLVRTALSKFVGS